MTLYFGDMLPPKPDDRRRRANVIVGVASPVKLDVRPIEEELTPDGTVCIGTFHGNRVLARCAIPAESITQFLEMDLFDNPVAVALNVRRGGPGLTGNVLALVPVDVASGTSREVDEPWKASVPGGGYDEQLAAGGDDDTPTLVGIFLGEVVRFEDDRRAPASLLREAADMLGCVLRGEVASVGGRVLEDLTARPAE